MKKIVNMQFAHFLYWLKMTKLLVFSRVSNKLVFANNELAGLTQTSLLGNWRNSERIMQNKTLPSALESDSPKASLLPMSAMLALPPFASCLFILLPVSIVWLQGRYSRVSLLSFNFKINLFIHWINTTWGLDLGTMGREVIKLTKALPSLKQIISKIHGVYHDRVKEKKIKQRSEIRSTIERVGNGQSSGQGKQVIFTSRKWGRRSSDISKSILGTR